MGILNQVIKNSSVGYTDATFLVEKKEGGGFKKTSVPLIFNMLFWKNFNDTYQLMQNDIIKIFDVEDKDKVGATLDFEKLKDAKYKKKEKEHAGEIFLDKFPDICFLAYKSYCETKAIEVDLTLEEVHDACAEHLINKEKNAFFQEEVVRIFHVLITSSVLFNKENNGIKRYENDGKGSKKKK